MLWGYARADTRDELERQVAAIHAAGLPPESVYADLATRRTDRPRHRDLVERVTVGDLVVVEALAPLGLTVGETLGLIRGWALQGVAVRALTGPVLIDTSDLDDPTTQRTLGVLALVEDLYDAYVQERVEVNRRTAQAQGRSSQSCQSPS